MLIRLKEPLEVDLWAEGDPQPSPLPGVVALDPAVVGQSKPPPEPAPVLHVSPEATAHAGRAVANVTPAGYYGASEPSPPQETPMTQEQALPSLEETHAMVQDFAAQVDAYPPNEPGRAGQSAFGAASSESKTPAWLKPDPQGNPWAFWVEHREIQGRFVMHKPSLRMEIAVERIKGREMGPEPTLDGALLAEWFAVLSVGFEDVPGGLESWDPGALVSEDLIQGLYNRMSHAWDRFRRTGQPPEAI